jgi:hypothetical protein
MDDGFPGRRHGSTAGMMPALKQAAMIVVSALLSEVLFVSYRTLAHTD